jgi:hypothetical protein
MIRTSFRACSSRCAVTPSAATAAPLLDGMQVNIAAADIDHLAATLQHKVSRGKVYLTKELAP